MSRPKKSNNLTLLFFAGYLLFMCSIIASAMFIDSPKINESITSEKVNPTFKEALETYEKQQEEKRQNKRKWKVSNEFVMTAVTIGAVLDIIIIIVWAKTQNRKLKESKDLKKGKWLYSKLFWNIVALGVIQPKDNKVVMNWYNAAAVSILIHLFFYFLLMK